MPPPKYNLKLNIPVYGAQKTTREHANPITFDLNHDKTTGNYLTKAIIV